MTWIADVQFLSNGKNPGIALEQKINRTTNANMNENSDKNTNTDAFVLVEENDYSFSCEGKWWNKCKSNY